MCWRIPILQWRRTQVDGNTYDSDGDVNTGSGMVAAQGGAGSTAEGAGMIYVTDSTVGEGVSRIKGLSTQAECL